MTNSVANSAALRAAQHEFARRDQQGDQTSPAGLATAQANPEAAPHVVFRRPETGAPQPAFATAATARLFDALGWRIIPSPRREAAYHKPLRCCFVLGDGTRQEAAFGYTGVTAPLDGENPDLAAAQIRVERFLHHLGEDSGVLVQNTPLIAFGGPRRDRLVVFGGWRFHDRYWRPFVLSPDGLDGVSVQTTFFDARTAPHHLAEIFGVAADKALPRVTDVVSAIAACPNPENPETSPEDAAKPAAPGRRMAAGLRIVPFTDGWSIAQPGAPAALTSLPLPSERGKAPNPVKSHILETEHRTPSSSPAETAGRREGPLSPLAPNGLPWDLGEDEFRFRHRPSGRS